MDVSSLVAYVGFFDHSFKSLARKLWMYSVQVEKSYMNAICMYRLQPYAYIYIYIYIYIARRSLCGSYNEKLAIWEFRTGNWEF